MKKCFKITGGLAAIGIIAAVLIYVFVINKAHPDYEQEKASYVLQAEELFDQYRSGNAANEKYTGKVIQITGILQKIDQADSADIVIFVFDEGMFGDEGVRCTMLPKYTEQCKAYALNTSITIKGYCTGYNDTDVVLKYCSIISSRE